MTDNRDNDIDDDDDETQDPGLDPAEIAQLREKARERERQESAVVNALPRPSPPQAFAGSPKTKLANKTSRKMQSRSKTSPNKKTLYNDAKDEFGFSNEADGSDGASIDATGKVTPLGTGNGSAHNAVAKVALAKSADKYEEKTRIQAYENTVANLASPPADNRAAAPRRRNLPMPGAFAYDGPGASQTEDDPDAILLERTDTEAAVMPVDSLVEASMVDTAEKVHVAEDVRKDYHRRIMLIIAGFFTLVIAVVVTLIVIRQEKGFPDLCDIPLDDQSVALRCNCSGTTGQFYDSLTEVGKEAYSEQHAFLIEAGIFNTSAVTDVDSCDTNNLNLLIAANISEISEGGVNFWTKSSADFRLSVYALINMYLTMGGLNWKTADDWLSDKICDWEGNTCIFLEILEEFEMTDNGLVGPLPTELGLLQTLRKFEISENEGVTGQVPPQIGTLDSLQELILRDLNLSSTIPTEVGLLPRIDELDLSGNRLTGTIPDQIWENRNLRFLRLDHNGLTGTLPQNIGAATNLLELELEKNALSGTIPTQLTLLTNLEILSLSDNDFEGPIPSFLGEMSRLTLLFLHNSGFRSTVPSTFCNTTMRRVITVDCPNNAPPACDCCSETDSNAPVRFVCMNLDVES